MCWEAEFGAERGWAGGREGSEDRGAGTAGRVTLDPFEQDPHDDVDILVPVFFPGPRRRWARHLKI